MRLWIGLAVGLTACGSSDKTLEPHLTNAPVAMITSHTADDSVGQGNTVTFSGFVSDVDNEIDELTTTWWAGEDLVCDENIPSDDGFTSCAISIPSGDSLEVRLDVVDSRTLGASDKVTVGIDPSANPVVEIVAPEAGDGFVVGSAIPFSGLISDADTDPTELNVWWTVDGTRADGSWSVASSGTVEGDLDGLEVGEHSLELWAEDPQGNSDYAGVSVNVVPTDTDPACEITAPEADATSRWGMDLTLTVSVADAEQDADTLSVVWTTSVDGDWTQEAVAGSDGIASVTTDTLSKGTHTLTVTVTDGSGGTCVDDVVHKVGETPDVEITAPEDGAEFGPEDLIIFEGVVKDDETVPEALAVTWIADYDASVLCEGDPADSGGITRCNVYASALATVEQTITLRAEDEDGLYTDTYIRITVTDNTPPVVADVAITPNPANAEDTLTCSYTTSDADGDTVTVDVAWSIDGTVVGTDATLAGAFAKGDAVMCTATPSDGLEAGDPESAILTITNAAPSISAVSITPNPAYPGDTLTCAYAGFSDSDGDADASTLSWTVNGSVVGDGSDTLVDVFGEGDEVGCTATPYDGEDFGSSVSDAITIDARVPRVDTVTITPDPAYAGNVLTCAWTGFFAPDGGTDASTLVWTDSGVDIGTSATLSGDFVRDDSLTCTVTPIDSDGTSGAPVSASITISNTPPTIADLAIAPAGPSVVSTLSFTATLSDADGDAVSTDSLWADADGTAISTAPTVDLTGRGLTIGTWILLIVTPTDGVDAGIPTEAWVELQNARPEVLTLSLSPSMVYTDDIVTAAVTTSDDEGDAITVSYAWTVNGTLVSGATSDSLDGAMYFDRDDTVQVVVTPSDAGGDGSPATSELITVLNSPPTAPTVSIEPASPTCVQDLVCSIDAVSTDADSDAISYTFTWTIDGDVFEVSEEDSPSGDTVLGMYTSCSQTWVCTVTPNDGTEDGPSGSDSVWPDSVVPDWDPVESLADADYGFNGVASIDLSGNAVSSAGDVDGDGLDDILIGAYYAAGSGSGSGHAGKSYLVLGASLDSTSTISLTDADYTFIGEEGGDNSGIAVSEAGDVDGDGLGDILIGAHQNEDGGYSAGKAYLILGASITTSTTIDLISANYSFVGESSEGLAGCALSSAGDVDGDGLDDIIIGARTADGGASGSGRIYIILGASLGDTETIDLADADYIIYGEGGDDYAGGAVSSAGDVDNDGLDDILIGAQYSNSGGSDSGKAYIILGKSLGDTTVISLSDADYKFIGEEGDDRAGKSVAAAGDVDGDGLDDILIGAWFSNDYESNAGKVYLVLGSRLGDDDVIDLVEADYAFVGEGPSEFAGISVAGNVDVDGDGLSDIVIGAYKNADAGTYAGKVYVITGASLMITPITVLSEADYAFLGEDGGDFAGHSVANAGDVNGDGRGDILVGAHEHTEDAGRAGKTYLLMP
jgi:hypothetical protein